MMGFSFLPVYPLLGALEVVLRCQVGTCAAEEETQFCLEALEWLCFRYYSFRCLVLGRMTGEKVS